MEKKSVIIIYIIYEGAPLQIHTHYKYLSLSAARIKILFTDGIIANTLVGNTDMFENNFFFIGVPSSIITFYPREFDQTLNRKKK